METKRENLKRLIEREVFVTKEQEAIAGGSNWIFDFRRVLLRAEVLDWIGELFWEKCKGEYPFQVGGVEVAGIPLFTALVIKLREKGEDANGFFIRKSRKKTGLLRMIEGAVTDEKIILVDDTMNTGKSFIRQIEVLESLGKKVGAVFAILRYRDLSYYTYFHERGIRVFSLFELDDFKGSLAVKNNIDKKKEEPVPMPFAPQWYWRSEKPNLSRVCAKSAPAIDEKRIYFGTDEGSFWALNQSDGSVTWKHTTLFGSKERKTFSSPFLSDGTVYFGASDGNVYALDAETGKKKWVFMEADWVQSSPCVAPDIGLVFVGLEFGLWSKRGSLVALDAETGKKKWEVPMSGPALSSPAYSKRYGTVVFGADDSVSGFDAKTGKLLWTFGMEGQVRESFAFDESSGRVVFGSTDSHVYVLETRTGKLLHAVKTNEAIWTTPLVYDHFAYVASLDKNLYCINLDTGAVVWTFATKGRIFSSPEMVGDKVYIGSNDGRLYELDALTGRETAFFQAIERITDKIAYNKNTGAFFLLTYANELYCLKKDENE
ncbi:MAG: PQQ-binding-like beta-propeller repeat protein [Candidatus Paceibacterota bacterium]